MQPFLFESVVRAGGNSLKRLDLPRKFFGPPTPRLNAFLREYNQLLGSRGSTCTACNETCGEQDGWVTFDYERANLGCGVQRHVCYSCTKYFCDIFPPVPECSLFLCAKCDRDCCYNCTEPCDHCQLVFCNDCSTIRECSGCWERGCVSPDCNAVFYRVACCGRTLCRKCGDFDVCDHCGKGHCADCYDDEKYDARACSDGHTHCFACNCISLQQRLGRSQAKLSA